METKNISQKTVFNASPKQVYDLIMDSKKHAGFTGASAKMGKKVGSKFSCYGGYISGKNLELKKNKKIVQSWRGKDFPKGYYSVVVFELNGKKGKTNLSFKHKGVPKKLAKHINEGWKKMYWKKMKDYLAKDKKKKK